MQIDPGKLINRGSLVALVLLSGLLILPFADLSANPLGWRAFAGVYEANLDVNYEEGAPGSFFLFTASGYPPNSVAMVTVNGEPNGYVMIGEDGSVEFVILTSTLLPPGTYLVMVGVGDVSAIESFELVDGGAVRPFPVGFAGPALAVGGTNELPILRKP